MGRNIAAILILALGCLGLSNTVRATGTEFIESVEPQVAHLKLKADHLRALSEKQVIVQSLPSKNSKEMAGIGVVLAAASPDAFVESYRTLATLQQSSNVQSSGVFSATPSLKDMDSLTIDDKDLYSLAKASVKDSDVKLSESEIARLQAIARTATRLTPQVKQRLAAEYKNIMLERVKSYLAKGVSALGTYADKDEAVSAQDSLISLAREQSETAGHCAHINSYLEKYPNGGAAGDESFVYWAKQKFGDLKPIINLVHVLIHKEGSRIFIASNQIYSSHYTEAGLSLAELIPFTDSAGLSRTIVAYTIRLQVDMLGGTLGFMKKRVAHPRMLGTLKESMNGLRVTMEAMSRASSQSRAGL